MRSLPECARPAPARARPARTWAEPLRREASARPPGLHVLQTLTFLPHEGLIAGGRATARPTKGSIGSSGWTRRTPGDVVRRERVRRRQKGLTLIGVRPLLRSLIDGTSAASRRRDAKCQYPTAPPVDRGST